MNLNEKIKIQNCEAAIEQVLNNLNIQFTTEICKVDKTKMFCTKRWTLYYCKDGYRIDSMNDPDDNYCEESLFDYKKIVAKLFNKKTLLQLSIEKHKKENSK